MRYEEQAIKISLNYFSIVYAGLDFVVITERLITPVVQGVIN